MLWVFLLVLCARTQEFIFSCISHDPFTAANVTVLDCAGEFKNLGRKIAKYIFISNILRNIGAI